MDVLSKLMEVGFTEYEARVYIALLADYPATGYHVGKAAGIPRSMVYEALGRLKARGAVLETEGSRATLYRPLPPDVLLDRHEQAQRLLVGQLREGLSELFQRQEEDLVWSVSGRGSILSYATQMLRQAQRELYLVLDDPDLQALRDGIVAASDRGVACNTVLTGDGALLCGQVVRHPPLESELHELAGTLLVVADGQEALVASCGGLRGSQLTGQLGQMDMIATITRNRDLVMIARQFVWMELFAQRIFVSLGEDLLERLDPEDRRIFESVAE